MCINVSVCNVQVLDMWGDDADAKTQILHLSWSVGSIIIPLIVRPFLVDRPEDIISNTTNVTTMAMVTDDTDQVNELDFEIPYLIIGCVCLLTGVVALCIYVCKPANGMVLSKKPTEKGDDNTMETDRCFFIQMLVLCCLLMFAIVGREYTLNTWLFTYAIESDLPFTKSEAALLASANKAAFTAGMVFSAAASKFVGPPPILFTVAGAGMILSLALGIWGTQYKTALWAISCILNLAQGPLWPTSILFTDKYIRASALVIGVLYAGAGMAAVIFHWLTGYLFTNAESADSFMYILVGCAAMLCIVLTVMQCVGMKHGNRYENERKLKAQEEVASTYLWNNNELEFALNCLASLQDRFIFIWGLGEQHDLHNYFWLVKKRQSSCFK